MTMKDPLALPAEKILKVSVQDPEKLFELDMFIMQFKRMRMKWHPDRNDDPLATEVFEHLMQLAETAKRRIATNTWNGKATLSYLTKDGKKFRFFYRKFRAFEMGRMYIGDYKVVFVVDEQYEKYYKNGLKTIKGIKYKNDKFKKEFEPMMPKIIRADKADIGYVVVMEKPEGTVLLQDLIDYMPNQTLPPKHTAWVLSSLYNIGVFFEFNGICHNSILPTTIFVNPEKHSVALLGGWWYSTKVDSKLMAIPAELTKILPKEVFKEKKSKTSYDRLAIKGVGIGCLGDPSLGGSKLLMSKDIPKPFLNWMRAPSLADAFREYEGWDQALEESFGKKKFIKLDVNINDVYK